MNILIDRKLGANTRFLLSETLGTRVFATARKNTDTPHGQKQLPSDQPKSLGKIKDFIIVESGPLPHVTEIIVKRGFGRPDLLIPVERIESITPKCVNLKPSDASEFEKPLSETALLLADYVLDKKVLDLEGREISVVFDVALLWVNNLRKMYVTDVEFGKKGLYRRLGLKLLADHVSGDNLVSWSYIQPLPESIGSFKGDVRLKAVKENLNDMPPVDVADIIEELDAEQRAGVFNQLDEESASDALEELEPNVQRQLISELEPAAVARLIDLMTPPQAADILAVLPYEDKQAIMNFLDGALAAKIHAILEKQEESILHYATERYITLKDTATIAYVKDNFATLAREKDVTMYIYVATADGKLEGVVDIKEILLASEAATLAEVMTRSIVTLEPSSTLREAYEVFQNYGYRALPVLSEERRLQGVIMYRDIINLNHRFVG